MKVNNCLIILLALLCVSLFLASALAIDETKATNEGQLNDAKQVQDGWGGGGGCHGRDCHGGGGHGGWGGGGGCHGRDCHGGGGHGGGGHGCRYGCCDGYYRRGGGCRQCCKTAQEYPTYMQNEVNRP